MSGLRVKSCAKSRIKSNNYKSCDYGVTIELKFIKKFKRIDLQLIKKLERINTGLIKRLEEIEKIKSLKIE